MADKTFHSLTLPGTDPARVPDVAAEFNTGTSYAVRDYCTYQGILYRCTTAHAAGAWNASHFQATNLDSEFDDKLKVPPYQSSAPANPRVGDLWIDDDEDSPILAIDPAPIAGSTNAVQSGGTRTLIDGVSVQKANRNLLTGDYSTSATYEVGQLVLYYPDNFSTTHQYVVGESCIRSGKVYKCITAHKGSWNASHFQEQYTTSTDTLYRCITRIGTPEAWTPAHWQATNINTELNRLRESEADTDMIAENFGDSSSYAVGDYVVHNSDLFRCIQAVSDTGSWDPDYWTQIVLANELNHLDHAFNNTLIKTNFNPELDIGKYWQQSNGLGSTNAKYCRTSGKWFGYPSRLGLALNNNTYLFDILYYDDEDQYLGFDDYSNGLIYLSNSAPSFRLSFKRVDGANMTQTDATAILESLFYYNNTDITLTKSFVAADAKVTGDNFSAFQTTLNPLPWSPSLFLGRYFRQDTGANAISSKYCRTTSLYYGYGYRNAFLLTNNNDYNMYMTIYDKTGATDGTGFIESTQSKDGIIYIPEKAIKFGITFSRKDNTIMTNEDLTFISENLIQYEATDRNLTLRNIAADAWQTGFINLQNEGGWINYKFLPNKNDYNYLITPKLFNGNMDYTTGEVTEDQTSVRVFTDLFTIDEDTYFEVYGTGISWRLIKYDKDTLNFVSSTSWTGQAENRSTVLKVSDNYAYRFGFYGNAINLNPKHSRQTILEKVQIYSGDSDIKSYLRNEYFTTIHSLQNITSNDDSCFSFGFMTDLHFSQKFTDYYEETRPGIINTFNIWVKLSKEFPLMAAVLGGDYMYFQAISGTTTTTLQSGIDNIHEINKRISDIDSPIQFAIAGNHEVGYTSGTTADQVTDYGLSLVQIRSWLSNKYLQKGVKKASDTVYYVIDNLNEVIWCFISTPIARFTTVETNGIDNIVSINNDNYPLICFNHYATTGSGELWAHISEYIDYIVTTKNQSIIAWIGGHIHADQQAVYNNTLIISCLQSGLKNSNASWDGNTYNHTKLTDTESCLSIFTVNKTTGKLFLTRFGAGIDREFNYNTTSGSIGLVTN